MVQYRYLICMVWLTVFDEVSTLMRCIAPVDVVLCLKLIEGHEVFGFFQATLGLGIISIYINVNYTASISLFLLWFESGIVMKGYVWMGYLMGLIGAVILFYLVDLED